MSVDEPVWDVIYYRTASGQVPADEFLDGCPTAIEARFERVLDDVACGPPLEYRGGGYWQAMHGSMTGWHEVRIKGPGRELYRLYCLLEKGTAEELAHRGLPRPAIAVIDGRRKPAKTAIPEEEYAAIRKLGEDHKRQFPRRIMEPDTADRSIASVAVSSDAVTVTTESGDARSIDLFGGLIGADQVARETWTLSGDGRTVYWPILNESCSIDDFFSDS